LLALPVSNTIKRAGADNLVNATVNRKELWQALTPQMFRLAPLMAALQSAIDHGQLVTDESQALELAGEKPRLLPGRVENIKITHNGDLALAEIYLK
jgi:2-C-methyl-D-erythritol 4-phosphate cytidylyltransferase